MEQLHGLLELPFLETRQLVCPESLSCISYVCLVDMKKHAKQSKLPHSESIN